MLLLLSLCGLLDAKAQSVSTEELKGTWTVASVTYAANDYTSAELARVEPLRKAFLDATFTFKKKKHFTFSINFEGLGIKDAQWQLDDTAHAIVIREWKDKGSGKSELMLIKTKKDNGRIIFMLDETLLVLEMKKQLE